MFLIVFVLDVDKDELEVVEEIREVFKKYKLNIKEKKGTDYELLG